MRVFFEEVMLDNPRMVVAEPVGEFHLRQRILVEPELVAGHPGPWQLQLIEDAELHDAVSPKFSCPLIVLALILMREAALSTEQQFRRAGERFLGRK
ncbi:hypothetical protein ACVW1A_003928 [Bradyrhizobium sp. LB1.3]